jgi:hypothetical protein
MGLGMLTLGASAALNASRSAAARQHATTIWRGLDAGTIYISTDGFYLANQQGLFSFGYGGLVSAGIAGPGLLHLDALMTDGSQQRFAISSSWAELIFVSWALKFCPRHPQMQNLGWLPRGFIEHVRDANIWHDSPLPELLA